MVVALVVLGPTRLPGAIRGIGRAIRQVREFSTTVRQEMDAAISPPVVEPPSPPAQPLSQQPADAPDHDGDTNGADSAADSTKQTNESPTGDGAT